MLLYNLFARLTLPLLVFVGASDLIPPRRSIKPLASDVNQAAANNIGSSTHEESGEKSFSLYTGSPVRQALFWSRRLDGEFRYVGQEDGFIIHRIWLRFMDGSERKAGLYHDFNSHFAEYDRDDAGNILNMTIYSGSFLDAVSYTTERTTNKIGGLGGTPHEQDVGNGVLMGFRGTLGGGYVASLTAIFHP